MPQDAYVIYDIGEMQADGFGVNEYPKWDGSAFVGDTPAGGSPGGSTKQVQYNNAGAFGGAAGFEWQNASPNVLIQAQDPTYEAMQVKAASLQSEKIITIRDASGNILSFIDERGIPAFYAGSADASNLFIGNSAGRAAATGNHNVCIGNAAGDAITSGIRNTFIGSYSGTNVTTGQQNVAIGYYAMIGTGSSYNTAIGHGALQSITNSSNVGIGHGAAGTSTDVRYMVAIGAAALASNTTGDGNLAIGFSALTSNTTGANNVAIGREAGEANLIGENCVYIGYQAGHTATGTHNLCIGYRAGDVITTGTYNVMIGDDVDPSGAGVDYELNIGNLIKGYLTGHGSGQSIHFFGGTPQTQQAHIVDADGTLADITTKFNTLLADLEGYGLLASS